MNLLRNLAALLACIATLALIGCGGGGSGSGSGPTTYTLGGTLSGLGTNESVSLQDNGGSTLNLSANGPYSFPTSLNTGSNYAVTVKSHTPGIACSVSGGSGTVGSSDVTSIDVSCTAGTEAILYSFGAGAKDGYDPQASLAMDSAGNLYGTTYQGGANSDGTAFKIGASGTETILYSFGASVADGKFPSASLIMDSAGNLYGTTSSGGPQDIGTVFEIDTSGTETLLHIFGVNAGGPEGADPTAGLSMDSAGNLYGTTSIGGANGEGTVFRIDTSGTETTLYSFGASATDGLNPSAGLIMDSAGYLYGTTEGGGANGFGTVFKVDISGMETVLYSFRAGATDGWQPTAGLVMDNARNFYGTTRQGGANGQGTVFKIDSTGTGSILHSFGANATDGMRPAGLIMDSAGNLYGTTWEGGAQNQGTVFKISPGGSTYTEMVLYSFGASSTDGREPVADLILDGVGNLYGTTESGGANGFGTVFKID